MKSLFLTVTSVIQAKGHDASAVTAGSLSDRTYGPGDKQNAINTCGVIPDMNQGRKNNPCFTLIARKSEEAGFVKIFADEKNIPKEKARISL